MYTAYDYTIEPLLVCPDSQELLAAHAAYDMGLVMQHEAAPKQPTSMAPDQQHTAVRLTVHQPAGALQGPSTNAAALSLDDDAAAVAAAAGPSDAANVGPGTVAAGMLRTPAVHSALESLDQTMRQLMNQRIQEVIQLTSDLDTLQRELDKVAAQRDAAVRERDAALQKAQLVSNEKANIVRQCDRLAQEVLQLQAELKAEKGVATAASMNATALQSQLQLLRSDMAQCNAESAQLLAHLKLAASAVHSATVVGGAGSQNTLVSSENMVHCVGPDNGHADRCGQQLMQHSNGINNLLVDQHDAAAPQPLQQSASDVNVDGVHGAPGTSNHKHLILHTAADESNSDQQHQQHQQNGRRPGRPSRKGDCPSNSGGMKQAVTAAAAEADILGNAGRDRYAMRKRKSDNETLPVEHGSCTLVGRAGRRQKVE